MVTTNSKADIKPITIDSLLEAHANFLKHNPAFIKALKCNRRTFYTIAHHITDTPIPVNPQASIFGMEVKLDPTLKYGEVEFEI